MRSDELKMALLLLLVLEATFLDDAKNCSVYLIHKVITWQRNVLVDRHVERLEREDKMLARLKYLRNLAR